jgi:hypothetical protein
VAASFNQTGYRDKKVVGVFIAFFVRPFMGEADNPMRHLDSRSKSLLHGRRGVRRIAAVNDQVKKNRTSV